jgi:hypothetical protein
VGKIHPDAEYIYFRHHPEHRDIVRPFLSAFDVTRGFTKSRADDTIACFYLKPEQFIAELVGLEREVLLVYAPHTEFQARTIKLLDDVVSEDRTRIEPLGTILVSDDPNTMEVVKQYCDTDLERPPIVSISKIKLETIKDANGIRNLLFTQLYQRDLFALESPLRTDITYFGRDDVTSMFLDRIRSGQNTGLFGLRRIGKTSVLYAIGRRAAAYSVAGTTYIDVSSPAAYKSRWWELLQIIVKEIADPLNLQKSDRSKTRALTITYTENDAATHFKADISHLFKFFPGERIVLLLDEIEHITFDISPSQHWTDDFLPFWQTIRSVHQDTKGLFVFILAGVNPHILEKDHVGRFDNPLFSTSKPVYLGPFDFTSTRAMVRRIGRYLGIKIEEAVYQRLLEEYGGHPFLIRQACSQIAKNIKVRPGDLTLTLFEKEIKGIAIALDRNVRQILNVLAIWYPEEYELVRLLALGDAKSFSEFANASASFTEHVEGYGLVTDSRGNPTLRIGLVREHLARSPKSPSALQAPASDRDAVMAEISRRRNAVELALRRTLHDGLRFGKGAKAAETVMNSLSAERKAMLMRFGYDDLWEELYFSELSTILSNNWSDFSNYFSTEKAKVLHWMEHINRCRSDAHAKKLSEDDLLFLRVCFKRMEEFLGLK